MRRSFAAFGMDTMRRSFAAFGMGMTRRDFAAGGAQTAIRVRGQPISARSSPQQPSANATIAAVEAIMKAMPRLFAASE